MVDATGANANQGELVNKQVVYMLYIGAGSAFASFVSFAALIGTASRQVMRIRRAYLAAVLRQDMAFFDGAMPGAISSRVSEDCVYLQEGMSQKVAECVQAVAQVIAGFGVAFYFGWQLTLVLMAGVPVMGFLAVRLFKLVQEGGVTGLKAYANAATIASETLGSIRTVQAFRGEKTAGERYDKELAKAEKIAIREYWGGACTGASFLGVSQDSAEHFFKIERTALHSYGPDPHSC